jgi:two-component system, OmpR family, sensor kinase
MTWRLALRYVAVFALVLAALSVGAYVFVGREYASLLMPALATPEGATAYANAMRRVAATIVAFDVPLLVVVGIASWLLARASIEPLLEARERERAFAADAAHALRSPLATIASVAQASRGGENSPADEAFGTIARSALDASQTVSELLTLARSAQPHALAKEPIDLAAVTADTALEFREVAARKATQLQLDLHSAIVDADERRVRELLRNLLSNAVRHARSDVRIAVSARDDVAELVVANDGDPIEPQARARIFERFYRANGSAEGSGLGLAIVRWIAQAHGGSVMLREGANEATEFVVRLPLLKPAS